MTKRATNIQILQNYVQQHWVMQNEDVRYTKTFWKLIDDCKHDAKMATDFVTTNLLSGGVQDRVVAAVLSGQICNPIEPEIAPYAEVISVYLLSSADTESNVSVLANVAVALKFMELSPKIAHATITLTYHLNENVRFFATQSLSGMLDGASATNAVLDRLIELSADEDGDIRDWSTFGLVNLVEIYEIDDQRIRDAFFARVNDRHYDARAEAFYGLAVSKDMRGVEPLKKYLTNSNTVGTLSIKASLAFASSELYEPLLALKKWWDLDDDLLNKAIAASKLTI